MVSEIRLDWGGGVSWVGLGGLGRLGCRLERWSPTHPQPLSPHRAKGGGLTAEFGLVFFGKMYTPMGRWLRPLLDAHQTTNKTHHRPNFLVHQPVGPTACTSPVQRVSQIGLLGPSLARRGERGGGERGNQRHWRQPNRQNKTKPRPTPPLTAHTPPTPPPRSSASPRAAPP